MVRIRFRRVGAKRQASYRIVAADRESPRDGRFLEVLGHYNPRTEPSTIRVDEARLFHWMEHGAQPSDSVVRTLRRLGTWERWERYKGGESLETLLKEAEAAMPEVDPRTRRDDLVGKRRKKRRAKAAEMEAEAAAKPRAEEEPEKAVKAEPEAEAAEAVAEEPAGEAEQDPEAEAAEDASEEDASAAEQPSDEPDSEAADAPEDSESSDEEA